MFWRILLERPNALVLWWICACLTCVSGLRSLERNLNFLICIHVFELVLKNGSDINDWNCLQLLFYFIVLMVIVASLLNWDNFQLVSGFRLKLFRSALWRKHMQLDSKSDFTPNGLTLEFFVRLSLVSSTSYLIGLKFGRIAHSIFFFNGIKFFWLFCLRCILVCFIKMLLPFRHKTLQYRLISLRNDLQIYSIFLWLKSSFSWK